ncbi:MAG TPA: glycine oxidase ThiO [Alphaproteobacteria bacterium]
MRTSSFSATADLVIIGGGIIGLAAAFRAAQAGLRVTLLERATLGGGATQIAAGMLSPALEAEDADPLLIEFAQDSVTRYPAFVAAVEAASGLSCSLRTEGGLWVALDHDDQVLLERMHVIHQGLGLNTELLTADDARRREPNISPRTLGGLAAPDDRQIDPRKFANALAAALRQQQVTLVDGAGDVALIADGDRVAGAVCAGGRIHAPTVLLAAGCHTNELLPAGVAPLPLRPVKGQTVRLRGAPVIEHVLRTPRVYLVPRADGEVVVGATMEEQGYDARATVWAVHELLTEARRAVPAIDELAIAELAVGFRPALRDHAPAIGAYGPAGLYVATGHFRHGVLLAVATAELVLELLTGGPHDRRLASFDPNRFVRSGGRGD